MTAKKKQSENYAIVANKSYGLFAGIVERREMQEDGTIRVLMRECRHVARWFGRTGGITSLAAYGLCGPDADKSKIGAPAPGLSDLTGIVNIFPCSKEARATLRAAKQS